MKLPDQLKLLIRDVPDFPKPGIMFKDITPAISNPDVCKEVIENIKTHFSTIHIDAIAAIEARGFIFGGMLAQAMGLPFIPVRKSGKLPYKKIEQEYSLEYGTACLEMHSDSIKEGWNVLIHDDLLATGGTAEATGKMIESLKGNVAGFSFIVNLSFLDGSKKLTNRFGLIPHFLIAY